MSRSWKVAVLDVGLADPVRQAGLSDPEVLGELGELLTGLSVPRDADDVVAKLSGIRAGMMHILPCNTPQRHRTCVTYPCSSPKASKQPIGR